MPSRDVRLSVYPSVRPWILSKRINISSKIFHNGWPHHSSFSTPNVMTIFQIFRRSDGKPPNWGGGSNEGAVGKIAILDEYLPIGSMTAAVRTTTATVDRAVYGTDRQSSVDLCLSQPAWTTTTKRREQIRIYLYAAVNLKQK